MTVPRLYPPVYLVLVLAAMVALDRWLPLAVIIPAPWRHAGWLLIAAGVGLAYLGKRRFDKAGTTVIPFRDSTAIVTDGPYRFSRNPMYLGIMAVVLGAFVLLGSLSPALMPPVMFLILDRLFIRGEERVLEARFGDAYQTYKKRTRRWL